MFPEDFEKILQSPPEPKSAAQTMPQLPVPFEAAFQQMGPGRWNFMSERPACGGVSWFIVVSAESAAFSCATLACELGVRLD